MRTRRYGFTITRWCVAPAPQLMLRSDGAEELADSGHPGVLGYDDGFWSKADVGKQMLFEQENAPPLKNPTWEDIESALLGIHPKTRSFFVLSGRKSYVQAAGAKLRLTIEYRARKLFSHKHFRVGREPLSEEVLSLNYSGGAIQVRKSEVLTLEDCLSVFRSFFDSEQVTGGYHLRELNDNLQ